MASFNNNQEDMDHGDDPPPANPMIRRPNQNLLAMFAPVASPRRAQRNQQRRTNNNTRAINLTDELEPHYCNLTPQDAYELDLSHLTRDKLVNYGFDDPLLAHILSPQLYTGYMVHIADTIHANVTNGALEDAAGPIYEQMLGQAVSHCLPRLSRHHQEVLQKKQSKEADLTYLQNFVDVLQRKPAMLGASLINHDQLIALNHAFPVMPCPFCHQKMPSVNDEFGGMMPTTAPYPPRGSNGRQRFEWPGHRNLTPDVWQQHMLQWQCELHHTTSQPGDKAFRHKRQVSVALHRLLGLTTNYIKDHLGRNARALQSYRPPPPPPPLLLQNGPPDVQTPPGGSAAMNNRAPPIVTQRTTAPLDTNNRAPPLDIQQRAPPRTPTNQTPPAVTKTPTAPRTAPNPDPPPPHQNDTHAPPDPSLELNDINNQLDELADAGSSDPDSDIETCPPIGANDIPNMRWLQRADDTAAKAALVADSTPAPHLQHILRQTQQTDAFTAPPHSQVPEAGAAAKK